MLSLFSQLYRRRKLRNASLEELKRAHLTGEAEILHGVTGARHVGDFVFGGIDGVVTTFAVVAGVAGAALSPAVVLILGIANLLADGFAMGVGNYLSLKSEREHYQHESEQELWEIENIPDQERKEVEDIYRAKGFEGEALQHAVRTITADKQRWLTTMMQEELGLAEEVRSAIKGGVTTFTAFLVIGSIPLLSYVVALFYPTILPFTFPVSIVLTLLALFITGALKAIVVPRPWWKSGAETLFMGGVAAAVAYIIGYLLRDLTQGAL